MKALEKILATGKTHTTFSDQDAPRGHNSRLDIALSSPGDAKPAHALPSVEPHPTAERLFAGAWSACYTIAVAVAAQNMKVAIPGDASVDIEIDLGMNGPDYFLQARLYVQLPGLSQDIAEVIAHKADEVCPYSKATRGNIPVTLHVATG